MRRDRYEGKKKIASILACAMLLSAAPVEAMAYTVPDTVRVGAGIGL